MDLAADGHRPAGFIGPVAMDTKGMQEIQHRASDKAALATALSSNSRMRVDPAQVDDLAAFFEHEAQALSDRAYDVQELASVTPPGGDPVSTNAAAVYGNVGGGGNQGYYDNYMSLAKVFTETAARLRDNARQTRTDDQNAGDNFRGGIRA